MKKRKAPRASNPTLERFCAERDSAMSAIGKALRERDFSTIEEAGEFLKQFIGLPMGQIPEVLNRGAKAETDEEKADRLFVSAMEKDSVGVLRRGLKEVLKVNPQHVRALTALALSERNAVRSEKGLREAIAIGEKSVGPLMEESKGELWGYVEARPYLEARYYLAEFLSMKEKRISEAVEECQAILALNTNDNQGVRDLLLGLLLREQRYEEAGRLVVRYKDDCSAIWMYGKVMLSFVQAARDANLNTEDDFHQWFVARIQSIGVDGASASVEFRVAEAELQRALDQNPWGAVYLLMPQSHFETPMPESYVEGGEEEARVLLEFQGMAWMRNPSAMIWLLLTASPWLIKHGFNPELLGGWGGAQN